MDYDTYLRTIRGVNVPDNYVIPSVDEMTIKTDGQHKEGAPIEKNPRIRYFERAAYVGAQAYEDDLNDFLDYLEQKRCSGTITFTVNGVYVTYSANR
jgi:hypothetical protein